MSTTTRSTASDCPSFFCMKVFNWLRRLAFEELSDWDQAEDVASSVMLRLISLYRDGKFDPEKRGAASFASAVLRYEILALFSKRRKAREWVREGGAELIKEERRRSPGSESSGLSAATIARYERTLRMMRDVCTPVQFRRTMKFLHGTPCTEQAKEEGVIGQCVRMSVDQALTKFRKKSGLPIGGRLRIA